MPVNLFFIAGQISRSFFSFTLLYRIKDFPGYRMNKKQGARSSRFGPSSTKSHHTTLSGCLYSRAQLKWAAHYAECSQCHLNSEVHLQPRIHSPAQEPANKVNSYIWCRGSLVHLSMHLCIADELVIWKAPAKREIPLQPLSIATCLCLSPPWWIYSS